MPEGTFVRPRILCLEYYRDMTNWDIAKTSLTCAKCENGFAEEQEVFSALYDEPEGFSRKDFCSDCWAASSGSGAFSFWRTLVPRRDAPVKRFVDDEIVLSLFRRLEGHADEQKINFRYVLALLLMRKKLLKFKEFRREPAGDCLLLTEKSGDVEHRVADANLTEEQIEQVTAELGQILNAKL